MASKTGSRSVVRQSGVIPYRVMGGEVFVLLVTSRSGKRWLVPKGHVEDGLTGAESAQKEAIEEAGAVGFAFDGAVGKYRYEKRGKVHEVELFPMEVVRLRGAWEEMHERERMWMRADEAAGMVEHKGLGSCLRALGEMAGAGVGAAA
jgi:phosphohistidine phosphatase